MCDVKNSVTLPFEPAWIYISAEWIF